MKHGRDRRDPSDLVVLARRGELSESDARSLRELLAASPADRVLDEAGRAFDREAPVETGDDERIEAIERAVMERLDRDRRVPLPPPRARWSIRIAVAAALLAATAVGATSVTRARWATEGAPVASPPSAHPLFTPPPIAPTPPEPAGSIALPARAPDPPAPPSTGAAPVRVVSPSRAPSSASAPPPPVEKSAEKTAAELFAAASDARLRGDTREAIRCSRELVDRYPSSREASTTRLSLGMLWLKSGDPAAALEEFRRSREAGGPTRSEAMWGEGQALRALGRAREERAVLEELRDHGDPAYSSAAKKRLAELCD